MGRGERDGGAGGGSAGGGSDSYPCPPQPAAPIPHSIPNNNVVQKIHILECLLDKS